MAIGKNQCEHGKLARQCEICELERENAELDREKSFLLTALAGCRDTFDYGDHMIESKAIADPLCVPDFVEKEVNTLRAQLALYEKTLRPYFTSHNSIPIERATIPAEVFNSITSEQAKLDAEVLRAAYAYGNDFNPELQHTSTGYPDTELAIDLIKAVQAAKEARGDTPMV